MTPAAGRRCVFCDAIVMPQQDADWSRGVALTDHIEQVHRVVGTRMMAAVMASMSRRV